MRIENPLTPLHTQYPTTTQNFNPPPVRQPQERYGPAATVNISEEGWAAYARDKARPAASGTGKIDLANNPAECKTCSSRTYKDVSDDPSVSFQTPTRISPGQSASMVAAHENEHVSNEQAKADREGREIISQSVTLRSSICPECNRVYISGGTTYMVSRARDSE